MRTILCTHLCLAGMILVAAPRLHGQDDPVRVKLDEAKAAFRSRVSALKEALGAKLQKTIDAARKQGDREALLQASQAKEDLEGKGILPDGLASAEQRGELKKSLQALDQAFENAIKGYTKAGQDSLAEKAAAERSVFLAEFGALTAARKAESTEGPSAGKKSAEEPLGAWGRWEKFPGAKVGGPRCVVWQDESGWHLRVLTETKLRKFEGTIHVIGGKLTRLAGLDGLEPRGKQKDTLTWNEERDRISYQFNCKGGEDGFDFKLSGEAARLRCVMKLDGYDHPETIFIGSEGRHPERAEFLLQSKPLKKVK